MRHDTLRYLTAWLLAAVMPVAALSQEEKPEEAPASQEKPKAEKPQSGEPTETGESDEKKKDTEEAAEAEPPKKEFHQSGLPKPPSFFDPKETKGEKPAVERYVSGLPKPPPLRSVEKAEGEAGHSPANKKSQELLEAAEPLTIAERLHRLSSRKRQPLLAPVEPDGMPTTVEPVELESPKDIIRHVRVSVLLRNGQVFEGIVKDQQVVRELREGRLVLGRSAGKSGRGFRLWYIYETEGYIRIEYDQIREIKVIRTLTPNEIEDMQNRLAARKEETLGEELERRRVREERQAAREAAQEAEAELAREKANKAASNAEMELAEEYTALLEKFPPEQGWTPERKEEIERRKITVDIFPNDKEQAFLDNFEKWLPAYHAWVEAKEIEAEKAKSDASKTKLPAPPAKKGEKTEPAAKDGKEEKDNG
ncbi:MAG: hypothetical protein RL885_22630 [Planctomycetota bacterium]